MGSYQRAAMAGDGGMTIWITGGFMDYGAHWARSWRLANRFAVPHTGRRSGGHYFRRPRNIGVKRATVADDGTLRGAKVPPDSWDDVSFSHRFARNWKRHRKTQWHERYMV